MVALIYPVAVVGRVPPLVTVLPPPSVMAPLPELSRVGTQAIGSLLDGEKENSLMPLTSASNGELFGLRKIDTWKSGSLPFADSTSFDVAISPLLCDASLSSGSPGKSV